MQVLLLFFLLSGLIKGQIMCDLYQSTNGFIDYSKWAKHLLRDFIKQHNESFQISIFLELYVIFWIFTMYLRNAVN